MKCMDTITIPKTKYEKLKRQAATYRQILSSRAEALYILTHVPNKETRKALEELQSPTKRRGLKKYASTKAMFDDVLKPHMRSIKKNQKKLPAGLRQALREVQQRKLSGPFETVDEFMAHLRR